MANSPIALLLKNNHHEISIYFTDICVISICFSYFCSICETVTATVKYIEGYGESGDAFTFKVVSGKRYMVYNAGGTSPIKGESLIQQSAKSKQKICLVLDSYPNEPRMVQAVKKGACK